jgi:hypothetical protein
MVRHDGLKGRASPGNTRADRPLKLRSFATPQYGGSGAMESDMLTLSIWPSG